MSHTKKILYAVKQAERGEPSTHADYLFWCPGCQCAHGVWTTKQNGVGATWSFNGDMDKPTFNPSLLIRFTRDITDAEHLQIMSGVPLNLPKSVCHSFVRDGQIQFLSDCTHHLAGKTVPMEAF
jgi:hypothetical protein